jgi:hypothetical protein
LGAVVLGALFGAPFILAPRPARAEVELPRLSPAAAVTQQIGLTEVTVEYGSPAVRGRKIWGSAVPYDRVWSITTDQATKVKFSKDVQVGGKAVAAGTYVLRAVPGKSDWTFQLAKVAAPSKGGESRPEPEAIQVKAHAKPVPHRERLTFLFSDFNEEKASLDLEWEKVRVSIPIAVNTGQQVQAGIADLDAAWRSYANAARYMLETKKDFDAGLKYADQSLALKEDWYTYWVKGALLAAKKDWRGARENAEKAYQLGQKSGDGFTLERELRQNIAEWTKRGEPGSGNNLTAR